MGTEEPRPGRPEPLRAGASRCPGTATDRHVPDAPSLRDVPEYLSPAWFRAADLALRADVRLAAATRGAQLVLQQTVTDPPPPTTWHVRIDDGRVSLTQGAAADATVTFTCDRATATGIQRGETSAQAAFMAGHLRVGGDVGALLHHHELLASLTDALAPLRDQVG